MSGVSKVFRVFVYGTLKTGEPNHHWLTNPLNGLARFYGKGRTAVKYPLVIASRYNIPFILDEAGKGNNVFGEVFEIDDQMLSNLDILEGHPNFYTRRVETIILDGQTDQECWTYFLKHHKNELLKCPMLTSYCSRGDHGLLYVEPSKRDTTHDYKSEVLVDHQVTTEKGPNPSELLKVFVYGTLKTGEPNHHWLTKTENGYARLVSEGKTVVKYPLVIGSKYNIPFLLDEPGAGHNVSGEVYEINDTMLSNLDILEGYPEFYKRRLESIETRAAGVRERCWTYFLNGHKQHLLELPFYASYSSMGDHGLPYAESDNEATIDDV